MDVAASEFWLESDKVERPLEHPHLLTDLNPDSPNPHPHPRPLAPTLTPNPHPHLHPHLQVYDLDFKTENNDKSQRKTGEELMQVYKDFVTNYPMVSIEDPFDQDDFPTCARLQLHPTPRL